MSLVSHTEKSKEEEDEELSPVEEVADFKDDVEKEDGVEEE